MVIGFIAISKKMKDDYTVRSQVIDVLKQMKTLAADELQCETIDQSTTGQPTTDSQSVPENMPEADTAEMPAIEMSAELEPVPLIENLDADRSSESLSDELSKDDMANEPEASEDNTMTSEAKTLDSADITRNTDIIESMGYQIVDSSAIEVSVVFKDISGESGKKHVKAGSRVSISCDCESQALSCTTIESSLNKNYLPKTLTR